MKFGFFEPRGWTVAPPGFFQTLISEVSFPFTATVYGVSAIQFLHAQIAQSIEDANDAIYDEERGQNFS